MNRNSSVLLSLRLGNSVTDEIAVARDLDPGKRILAPLPVKGRCKYDVHASFKDWSSIDVRDVDLCADRNLVLTE